jgi:arsenate reductase
MDRLIVYHNPRCSKSRGTLELLEKRGVPFEVIEYMKTPPSRATLTDLARRLALPARAWVRTQEAEYAAAGLDANSPDERIMDAMAAHPALIERPIVVRGARAVIGRPPERVLALLDEGEADAG